MDSFSKGSGNKGRKMVMEFGGQARETYMRVSGRITSKMVREFMSILVGLSIQDILEIF